MRLLETIVENPWAASVGWTILHSLWEGLVLAAMLAIVLLATKSPRLRYTAACVSILAMLAAFAVTLHRMAPHAAHTLPALKALPFPGWNPAVTNTPNAWDPSLTAVAP